MTNQPTDTAELSSSVKNLPLKKWAPIVGISERVLRQAIYDRKLGHYRHGVSILVSEQHMTDYLLLHSVTPFAAEPRAGI